MYKPLALFFQLWGRGGAVLQQHRSLTQDRTPSVSSAFVESCPGAVAQGETCALSSPSCLLLVFLPSLLGFPPLALSLWAYLFCFSFPPVVPVPDPVGCTLSHSFGLCLHRGKHHCTTHSSAAKGHTDFASQDYTNEWIYRQEYPCRQSFFLKYKYQKMLTEGTFVILGEHLWPYSWFSSCSHLIKEPEHELFIQKSQLPFWQSSFLQSCLQIEDWECLSQKIFAKSFQIANGHLEN